MYILITYLCTHTHTHTQTHTHTLTQRVNNHGNPFVSGKQPLHIASGRGWLGAFTPLIISILLMLSSDSSDICVYACPTFERRKERTDDDAADEDDLVDATDLARACRGRSL